MAFSNKGSGKPWLTFATLHEQVAELLMDAGLFFTFHRKDSDHGAVNSYDTFVMGRFFCPNDVCRSNAWGSKKIAITIRSYSGEQYNARVYRQRCKKCQTLGHLQLDEDSYAERVAYRLKKWSHVEVDKPVYNERKMTRPHKSDLCEGCKLGHCSWDL